MSKTFWIRFWDSLSDNRKSKIENLKWLGLSVIAFVLVVVGAVAHAQQPKKVSRIGVLSLGSPGPSPLLDAFRQGLRELGYVEGQNVALEYRFAEAKLEALPGLAAEVVRLKVDVLVTIATPAAIAAKNAT